MSQARAAGMISMLLPLEIRQGRLTILNAAAAFEQRARKATSRSTWRASDGREIR